MEEIGEMSARELMQWSAYERVYGSILPHERVDMGFAQVCYYLVALLGNQKRKPRFKDFLPRWLRDLSKPANDPDARALESALKGWADGDD